MRCENKFCNGAQSVQIIYFDGGKKHNRALCESCATSLLIQGLAYKKARQFKLEYYNANYQREGC